MEKNYNTIHELRKKIEMLEQSRVDQLNTRMNTNISGDLSILYS
jgi:hypothetical protein